ncbi:60S ribosomal protein L5 [Mitosporidium daphniae]
MPFVKLVKNKAYFKRFQVKYRRRREGKTDYYARKRLVVQAKNKYNTPKYRLVVRITNTDIVCQIMYARIQGDIVFASAYAHELPRYGVKVGLTNFASAYCTGLLCARRALAKLGLDSKYEGKAKADGEYFLVDSIEGDDSPRPFKAFLDVGLSRTTTGSRIFGALKGAVDGGIYVPHSDRRFPGYSTETKKVDTNVLRKYIFGQHVADYMTLLKEDDHESYEKQFSKYIKNGVTADAIKGIYAKAHELIRKDPSFKPSQKKVSEMAERSKSFKKQRLTYEERKANIAKKIAEFKESVMQ